MKRHYSRSGRSGMVSPALNGRMDSCIAHPGNVCAILAWNRRSIIAHPGVLSHPESAKLYRNVADRNPRYRDCLAIEDLHAMYLVQRLPLRLKSLLHPWLCSCHSRVRAGSFQSYCPPSLKNLGLGSAKSLCPDCSAKYAE